MLFFLPGIVAGFFWPETLISISTGAVIFTFEIVEWLISRLLTGFSAPIT